MSTHSPSPDLDSSLFTAHGEDPTWRISFSLKISSKANPLTSTKRPTKKRWRISFCNRHLQNVQIPGSISVDMLFSDFMPFSIKDFGVDQKLECISIGKRRGKEGRERVCFQKRWCLRENNDASSSSIAGVSTS
ncbi:hypothetical protein F3Y22_tig00111005pilonHSYRG00140 [Hibiscus syriacus]|uniref:Uncharacterized protein n=1 Tax=Hibiscus syriacus TaxID=106335 RepID=A0A6A2ZA74_HIBSY|nr:hypothetical protein F3Y22_tig00111005pilonHSYRG00140 [Hibiscus syriacus]